jgi:hypothetical protein
LINTCHDARFAPHVCANDNAVRRGSRLVGGTDSERGASTRDQSVELEANELWPIDIMYECPQGHEMEMIAVGRLWHCDVCKTSLESLESVSPIMRIRICTAEGVIMTCAGRASKIMSDA